MRGIQALLRGRWRSWGQEQRKSSQLTRTFVLLLGALTVPLAACNALGPSSGNSALAASQTFSWPYVDQSGKIGHNEVFDPALVAALKDTGSVSMLYTGLVTQSPTLTVQPDAALNWSVDPTATIYTFHLRPHMFFSDGKPITASDFAYSIDRALDPNLCADQSAKTYYSTDPSLNNCPTYTGPTYLGHILGANDRNTGAVASIISNGDDPTKGLNVIDAQTLRIRLDSPISFFLESLTYPTADVVEKSMVTNPAYAGGLWVDHLDQGGASGPFKVQSYGDGTTMTLVPNTYWEQAFGQQLSLTKVIRTAVPTNDAEYKNYQQGLYDYTDVPTNQYSFARGQNDFHSVPTLETDYFGLNFKQAPFDNLSIRQAFDLALNKQLLVDRVENGGAIPSNHIVPEGMPGFFVGLKNPPPDRTQTLTGNQAAATSLLAKAQANCPKNGSTYNEPDYCPYITGSMEPIMVYAPSDSPTRIQIATLAAQEWSATLGLTVKVYPVSFDSLVGDITKPPSQNPASIWEIGWIADYPDPQDWLTIQFSTTAPNNSEGISDPNLDTKMKNADVEQNLANRMTLYNEVEQAVVDQAAWIPFQQVKSYWRVRSYVHGFGFNSIGQMVDINWPKVYVAEH
ncbi:MAG TPA: peptide ABC transporter substrate-binding protein [Ktedonobacterales bacterium]